MRLTLDRVREVLRYDPDTGLLHWKVGFGGKRIGTIAGGLKPELGYIVVKIDGWRYMAHTVIWFLVTGEWRPFGVDHCDTDGINNRWINLRSATKSQNMANRRRQSNNKVGLKGVSWSKRERKFTAEIVAAGKRYYLGDFRCPAAAHFAYVVKADQLFGEFARTG